MGSGQTVDVSMSAKLKPMPRRPADNWDQFRPLEVTRRRRSRSPLPKLLIATFLFVALVIIWGVFKPQIRGTVSEISQAISRLGQRPAASTKARSAASAAVRRTLRPAQRGLDARWEETARSHGPFEVYLLDGDRYIRVDSSSRSVLLNMRTGETTWLDSDTSTRQR
jgi:hypothetical protein